jgi:hypothetical protein
MPARVQYLARRLDRCCARLNTGLMAMAVALAVLAAGASAGRDTPPLATPAPAPNAAFVPVAWGP